MFGWWCDFILALSLLTTLPAPTRLYDKPVVGATPRGRLDYKRDGPAQELAPTPAASALNMTRKTLRVGATLRGRPNSGGRKGRQRGLPHSAAGSVRFFPLVGFIIGLILCIADRGLSLLFGPILKAALILALNVVLTGGLHLDGFIDTCDGLLSRQNREQTLAILRDTHVGGLGAAALVTLLIVKFAVLVEISGRLRLWALLLFPLMGRLSMSAAVCLFAYARPGAGMGRAYAQETGQRDLAVAVVISLLIVVVVCGYIKPSSKEVSIILVAAALSLGGPYLLARRIAAKLGGLTGDVYGAINEVAELLFLLALAAGAAGLA
ncbi:MAG: adenosylcobinamide-GDP ribazoletransferase [bacterium]